eukprot:TRINITY_DN141045_c0_g1_i1.p1 TRINITY_DN141045_c0_g1~~TRINITY_DN141045_c0_g1_i1.p1  ORF type:complete len:152 (+),score=4.06 TRINITY_DN141045_c0_g1_i1:33-488(+)
MVFQFCSYCFKSGCILSCGLLSSLTAFFGWSLLFYIIASIYFSPSTYYNVQPIYFDFLSTSPTGQIDLHPEIVEEPVVNLGLKSDIWMEAYVEGNVNQPQVFQVQAEILDTEKEIRFVSSRPFVPHQISQIKAAVMLYFYVNGWSLGNCKY